MDKSRSDLEGQLAGQDFGVKRENMKVLTQANELLKGKTFVLVYPGGEGQLFPRRSGTH